jgi:putative peptide zinc metalloprotease protein
MDFAPTDLEKRVLLLKNLLIFAHFSLLELTELAGLFNDVVYPTGSIIVQENEIIDSILVIIAGNAEVSRKNPLTENEQIDVLSVLHAGEAIGLNDIGFFSNTNLRSATVIAVTAVFAMRLDLKVIKQFLQAHPDKLPGIESAADNILAHAFIKKLEPFAAVSDDLLQQIIPAIENINVPAETILCQQGDTAECCYLLYSGKVDVILTKADGSLSVIATIEPGELLGEMSLFTTNKRNATLKTVAACRLLVLKKKEFQQLVQHSVVAPSVLTSMLMDRHRPLRREGVTIHTREDAEKKKIVILKNAEKGIYVKTSEEGLFVWHLLDGEHTLQDIALAYFYRYRKLATEAIGNLVFHFMQTDFVEAPVLSAYVPQPGLPRWVRILANIRRFMQYEYSIKNVDAWVTQLYQRAGYLFFTRTAKILMAFLAIVGFGAFIGFLHNAGVILKATPNAWLLLVLMGPANIFAVPLHELAHALTTKAYGYQVHRLGVGWFWLGPMAFADTSDMWLSSRGPRIVVNLVGIYINTVISGILALLAWLVPNETVAVFLWLVALSSYLMAFYNLDPMFELDGYYALMDALDKPNLRTRAIKWLIQDFKKTLCSLTLIRQYFPEIMYWIISFSFILLATAMAYIVQTFIFNNILPEAIGHVHPTHFKWILSILVITLSFASLYSKVKHQAAIFQQK